MKRDVKVRAWILRGAAAAGLLLAAALAGCSQGHGVEAAHDESAAHAHGELAATYKAGFGVRFSETAAQFAGLRIGEVETRDLAGRADVAAVPREAVLRTVRGTFVYVENGSWLLRSPVRIGAEGAGWVEVTDGLYEGDRIATAGVEALWLAEIAAVNGGVGCADGH